MKSINRIIAPFVNSLSVITLIFLAQTDISAQNDGYVPVKKNTDLYLEYYKDYDDTRMVEVSLSLREKGQINYLEDQKVNLYIDEISDRGFVGSVTTNEYGNATLKSTASAFNDAINNKYSYEIFAVMEENERYMHDDVSIKIIDAQLNLNFFVEDNIKYVKAILNQYDSSMNLKPKEDVEIHFYIKRMLGLLPIGGDYTYTDQNGEISIEFPEDLTGNPDGMVELVARVEDEEEMGNITRRASIDWGKPLISDAGLNQNALWANRGNAPMFLIIIANIIILGVWLVILYLIFQIYRIRKMSKKIEQ